jgi:hypothetical protein
MLGALAGVDCGLTGGDIAIWLTGTDGSVAQPMAATARYHR